MSEVTLPTSPRFKNLKGMKFGRLTVVEYAGQTQNYHYEWKCRCGCGQIKSVLAGNLKSGGTKSCGCYHKEAQRKSVTSHGDTGSPEYVSWGSIIQRCENPNNTYYEYYGGRGIKICDGWRQSYVAFLKDMGRKPTELHSIDRVNSNGDYCLENCQWSTPTEQQRNRRNNKIITHNGETRCLSEWAEHTGIDYYLLWGRLKNNWTFERAITTPVRKRGVK